MYLEHSNNCVAITIIVFLCVPDVVLTAAII